MTSCTILEGQNGELQSWRDLRQETDGLICMYTWQQNVYTYIQVVLQSFVITVLRNCLYFGAFHFLQLSQGLGLVQLPCFTKASGELICDDNYTKAMSGETKVADVANQLRDRIPLNRNSFMRMFQWYHKTYIKTSSFAPVVHAIVGVGLIGYAIEYPHIKHELEEERKRAKEI